MTDNATKRRIYFTDKKDLKRTEFSTRGFGKSHDRKDYSFHGNALVKEFQNAVQTAVRSADSSVTSDVLVEIETPKGLKVKSVRHQLSELEIRVIKLDTNRENFATASIKKDQLSFLGDRLQGYATRSGNPYKGSISLIESIKSYNSEPPILDTEIGINPNDCIIVLYNYLTYQEKLEISKIIILHLERQGISGETLGFYDKYFVGIATRLDKVAAEKLSSEFMFIESIAVDHKLEISSLKIKSTTPSFLSALPSPKGTTAKFKIGIVDDGIAKNTFLKPFIKGISAQLPVGSTNISRVHGTFVASRAIFGDDFDYLIRTGNAISDLHDITVFGLDAHGEITKPSEIDVIKAIGKAVSSDKDIKIVNLSLGASPVSNGNISRLANFIDETAKSEGVIFTISSGNSVKPLTKSLAPEADPDHRITIPAESIMAITVGSYAKNHTPNCSAIKNSISSFSRLGPGFDQGLKPEIILSGGNSKITKDFFGNEFNDLESGAGVFGLDTSGAVREDIGTSFSAPVAANHFAQLMVEFPDATTNFYRAIYLHSCINGMPKPVTGILSRHFYGLGVPNIDSVIYNHRKSMLKITEDSLDDSNYLEIPFHVPEIFVNTKAKLGIKVTVVFDPDVDSTNPVEYIQSRISASIMKPSSVGRRQVDLDGSGDNYYKQWSPIISWTSTFDRSFRGGEWSLRLRLYTRFGVPKSYDQRFCAVIEVFDPSGGIDVEAEVQKDFPLKYGADVGTAS